MIQVLEHYETTNSLKTLICECCRAHLSYDYEDIMHNIHTKLKDIQCPKCNWKSYVKIGRNDNSIKKQ